MVAGKVALHGVCGNTLLPINKCFNSSETHLSLKSYWCGEGEGEEEEGGGEGKNFKLKSHTLQGDVAKQLKTRNSSRHAPLNETEQIKHCKVDNVVTGV